MNKFNECVDFICKQVAVQNKQQLTDAELEMLISLLEATLQNPPLRSLLIGNNIVDSFLSDDDKLKIKKKIQTIYNIFGHIYF